VSTSTENSIDPKLTPMMRQYLDIKKKHQNELLFFRLGDFYEMFFDDAHKASAVLDIALTRRQADVPMCGIPYHAAENYIARLIKAGYNVAICEQLEDTPSQGTIVKRDVVRIITPGTVIESNLLMSEDNNFLASCVFDDTHFALSCVDISTGDFIISVSEKSVDLFRGELSRFSPRELLFYSFSKKSTDNEYKQAAEEKNIPINKLNDWLYDVKYLTGSITDSFKIASLKGIGIESDLEIVSAGSIIEYIKETQKRTLDHLKFPRRLMRKTSMLLDEATIMHLELIQNQQDASKSRTLFSILNYTKTAMGKRTLERNIVEPLLEQSDIEMRLDTVEQFLSNKDLSSAVTESLSFIQDIERIVARMSLGKIFPRDFLAIAGSIRAAFDISKTLSLSDSGLLKENAKNIPDCTDLAHTIESTITEDPALTPEQGRIVKSGVNAELDRLHSLRSDAQTWILEYQEEEKNALGIPTLKVRYNKILGYYIEVSKGQADKVPAHYLRKQTLVGNERFTTEKLQSFETDVLSASEKMVTLENEIITTLLNKILQHRSTLQALASHIGMIDFYLSLAHAAREKRFVRPVINSSGLMKISEGRHPIVETYYTKEVFIPNDILFDSDENRLKIITGPNMSGKSTFIRMAATLQLMGQIGSFVPASSAELPIVDRIFTRIGASDNISRGESTFLVEMNETATILNNATDRSLIIMDEVGRGTSTYDGLSLAWAIVEYILSHINAKTLFATHYHELTKLSDKKGIVNYTVLVSENAGRVDFLHKVVPGSADKSYGIHVAKLAGIPREITSKAQKILERLEKSNKRLTVEESNTPQAEVGLFNATNHRVVQAIKSIDFNSITPLEALNELARIKKLIDE
jgi:DNA mismatch repair protein MutS